MRRSIALVGALLVIAAAASWRSTVLAQHETAADLLDGERAFRNTCATCHGPDGDQVAGIDLGRGRFRRVLSDDDLVRIIQTGIPNTAMAATNMTPEQARKIVAYLRSRAASARTGIVGDAARGRALFDGRGDCRSCHRVAGVGSRVGPDLTTVGSQRAAAELERALLDPDADVQPNHRFYRVVLRDGTTVEGRLLSHDTFTVQLIDTHEQLRSFTRGDLRESRFIPSPMPSYRGTLTPQEIADTVAYLASLRGR